MWNLLADLILLLDKGVFHFSVLDKLFFHFEKLDIHLVYLLGSFPE